MKSLIDISLIVEGIKGIIPVLPVGFAAPSVSKKTDIDTALASERRRPAGSPGA